jgi:anionic cell wall polymer biosynthesis LytR-Cps2A-Psr (LCP) family protein
LDSEILKGNLVDSSTNKNGSEVNDNHRILVVTESDKDAPSVLLLAINQKKNEIKYVNIPHRLKYKDSMIEFKTENGQLIENDFEELLGISIDQKLITSLEKLGEMVENVGGIRVRNGFEFSEGGIRFPEGDIDLFKSEDVVKYTAMRKSDPMGMYGRDNRIVSVMKELITSMDPNKYGFLDVNKDISIIEGERPTLNASIQDGKWFEVVDDASLAAFGLFLRQLIFLLAVLRALLTLNRC